jgi:hypothetical protein
LTHVEHLIFPADLLNTNEKIENYKSVSVQRQKRVLELKRKPDVEPLKKPLDDAQRNLDNNKKPLDVVQKKLKDNAKHKKPLGNVRQKKRLDVPQKKLKDNEKPLVSVQSKKKLKDNVKLFELAHKKKLEDKQKHSV